LYDRTRRSSLYGKTRASPGCAAIVRERLPNDAGQYREAGSGMREFLRLLSAGVGCSGGPAWAHNPKVAGSNPAPATKQNQGATVDAAAPFGFSTQMSPSTWSSSFCSALRAAVNASHQNPDT